MMHPLKEYLTETSVSVTGFASLIGVSRQTLHRILSGSQSPRPALARRIVDATNGAVGFEDLFATDKDDAAILDFTAMRAATGRTADDEALLEPVLLKHLLNLTLYALTRGDRARSRSRNHPDFPEDLGAAAAEAVANTYNALSGVTSRQGPDRLAQALRPVLEEILKENGGPAPAPDRLQRRLDEASDHAARLYYQALRLGATDDPIRK